MEFQNSLPIFYNAVIETDFKFVDITLYVFITKKLFELLEKNIISFI